MSSLKQNIIEKRSLLIILLLIAFQVFTAVIVVKIYLDGRLSRARKSADTEFHLLVRQVGYSLNKGDYEGIVKFLKTFTQNYARECQSLKLISKDGFSIFVYLNPREFTHVYKQEKYLSYLFKGRAKLIYEVGLDSIYTQTYTFTAYIVGLFLLTNLLLFIINFLSQSRKVAVEKLKAREKELLNTNKLLAREIEQRKTIEKELKEKNKYLDLINIAITEPFYIINVKDYSIAMANKASKIELNGSKKYCHWEAHRNPMPCYDNEHPCPIEIIRETKQPAIVEHIHIDELGNKKIYQVTGYPIFDEKGNFVQMIEYNVDVTEKREREEELKKLKIGIESLEEAVFITTKDGVITYFNPSFKKIYGYQTHEIIGKTPRILKSGLLPKEVYEQFWKTILSKEPVSGVIKNKRKDGTLVDVYSSVSPITDEKNEIIAFLAIQRDVTEEIKMQEEIKKAKEAAEEADKMKSHFLSKISEEIAIPLNSFIRYKDLLLKKLEDLNDADLKMIGEILAKSAEKIKVNTELVLNYSEVSIGNYKPTLASLDIYEDIILGVFIKFQSQAKIKGLALELNNVANVTSVFVDEFSTRQIIFNLLDNALKYTLEGGVTINLFNNTNKEVVVEIADTGIGMTDAEINKYLKPFETTDSNGSIEKEGVGIGLPLVQKYCEINNIEMEINSVKGNGTTIILIFKRNL